MRRLCFGLVAALLLFPMTIMSVLAAQDASPAAADSAFADLGLPTLDVTVTPDGFEGVPEELEAGRYLVTVTVAEDVEFGSGIGFVQPPEGMTPDEFLAAGEAPGPAEVEGEAPGGTPVLTDEASPAAMQGGPPAEIFQATYAGGIFALAGQSAQVVLDLPSGEWIAWADDPEATQEPVILNVTGEMPADLPAPEAGATVVMGEYLIEVSEGELVSGQQVIELQNIGAQPHFIFLGEIPDTVTEADIAAVLEIEMQAEMTGTPPVYEDFNPEEDFRPVFGTGTQSGGTTIWIPVTLEAGTYGAVCFFPDVSDGLPHAYHGMYTVLEVGE